MLLKDLFEKFVKDKIYDKNVTESTVKFYRASWAITEKYLKAKNVDELSRDVLRDLVYDWREKANQQPKSITTYVSALNSFFTWLHKEEYCKIHFKMEKPKVE